MTAKMEGHSALMATRFMPLSPILFSLFEPDDGNIHNTSLTWLLRPHAPDTEAF